MIADSVAFCREQGKRVVYDAEHFFDGYRDDPDYALECAPRRRRRRAPRTSPSATPTAAACPTFVAEATAAVVAALGDAVEVGIHTHNDGECAVANSLAAVEAGRAPGAGDDQRLRRALRQRQPRLDPAGPAAEDGLRGASAPSSSPSLTETAHYVDELCNMTADPDQPYVGRNAFAHKGGHARRRRRRRRPHLRAHRPGGGRQRARDPRLGALGQGDDPQPGRAGRARARRRGGRRARSSALKEREHRGYHYEAAPASFELLLRQEAGSYEPLFELESFRVTTEKRADGRVETEATIKVWVDGERYVRGRRGQRPGQRPRQGAARRRSSTATRTSPTSS